ncbi:hypothetical protein POM88_012781 [Heracleum sosnowskyi]|uniref:Serine-threonine/tyrosine-protein kinase catalytic domain-containing protein n=1 Tax=Heracleum sosnowskyi TaxID=360622 RepID=A0AAD8IXD3_9APIA|nr:hypothetical protein POM88_012781 [Heracleum sosnowskyi]
METVKKLDVTTSKENIDIESEVKIISNVHHRNIIRLLGCSGKGPVKLLVYKYMENGSIGMFLYGELPLDFQLQSFMFNMNYIYFGRRGRSRCRGIATAKERALYLGLVLWLLVRFASSKVMKPSSTCFPCTGSAKRLVKAALQEVARKRETRYSDCRRIEKKVQRHFHDDITFVVLFLNHDLIS